MWQVRREGFGQWRIREVDTDGRVIYEDPWVFSTRWGAIRDARKREHSHPHAHAEWRDIPTRGAA